MIPSRHTQVVEASLKAGGAKEDVAKVLEKILVIAAVTLNSIIVVRRDISPENAQRRRMIIIGIEKGSRIIMHCLGRLMIKMRTYL